MLLRLIQGVALLGLTVAIHAAVLGAILHRFQNAVQGHSPLGFIAHSWLLRPIATVTVLAHLTEIAIWAGLYCWKSTSEPRDQFLFQLRNPHAWMVRSVLLRSGQQALADQARRSTAGLAN